MAVATRPGQVPDSYEATLNQSERSELLQEQQAAGKTRHGRWCKKCNRAKPPRTHHCSVCNRCILRMDHHCPWVAGCVGFFNYRYFFLFLVYLWSGCVFVGITTAPLFFTTGHRYVFARNVEIVFEFVLTVSVTVAVGFLMFWHVYLACTAQTTLEFYANRSNESSIGLCDLWVRTEWDLGWRLNLKHTLAVRGKEDNMLWWFLPTLRPPIGDGTSFANRWDVSRQRVEDHALSVI
mmetsp:Transcript_73954/g.173629  ORF Transcript_73954/g.173629 Transcript_73954/m.173629 type:complete len:236 (+) Transcript_73954:44-751(+)